MTETVRCTTNGCSACDSLREREGKRHLVGQPCDLCNGTGVTYLGGGCRHREPKSDARCTSCGRPFGDCMAAPCAERKKLGRWAGGEADD